MIRRGIAFPFLDQPLDSGLSGGARQFAANGMAALSNRVSASSPPPDKGNRHACRTFPCHCRVHSLYVPEFGPFSSDIPSDSGSYPWPMIAVCIDRPRSAFFRPALTLILILIHL
jgi:hypothetical protein